MGDSKKNTRPRAYERDCYPWNRSRVPRTLAVDGKIEPHPYLSRAIFVVHGMGEQGWTDTASTLRNGFEDALEPIAEWQAKHPPKTGKPEDLMNPVPPPFVYEGYWADYADLEATFPEDWKRFNDRERRFFSKLWHARAYSIGRTYVWFLKQQIRLLNPKIIVDVSLLAWLIYIPLQIVMLATLTLAVLRHPVIISRILGDVRLYVDPKGQIERAIVQRIDQRVGEKFFFLMGLNWEFRPLPMNQRIIAANEALSFDRIIWVAHSLGTVVSYNVLSDIFHRAEELEQSGDAEQKAGVQLFRQSLRRFITMGSPLDKIAYLFGTKTLRPWPDKSRQDLLQGGDEIENASFSESREWWTNFYHVLDPVSGSLSNRTICGTKAPFNFHASWDVQASVPGLAHVSYWQNLQVLRFILSRTYGHKFLRDQLLKQHSPTLLAFTAFIGHVIWATILFGLSWILIHLAIRWWS